MKPVLIITRPSPDGACFASEVVSRVDVSVILSPLQQIIPIDAICEAQEFVFTSANGVAQAVRMGVKRGRAWCVGDRTAQVAREVGFDAMSAGGTVEDLLVLILQHKPANLLAHIRGREARGDLATRLTSAGVACADVIAYEQVPMALSNEARTAIEGVDAVIIPLFSPRAAVLLIDQVKIGPNAILIAMSKAVADQLGDLQVQVLDMPSGDVMLAKVIAACRKLSPL